MGDGLNGGIVARDRRWRQKPVEKRADCRLGAEEAFPETVDCLLREALFQDITEHFDDSRRGIGGHGIEEFPQAMSADGQPSEGGGEMEGECFAAALVMRSALVADNTSAANSEGAVLVAGQKPVENNRSRHSTGRTRNKFQAQMNVGEIFIRSVVSGKFQKPPALPNCDRL
jgi:hypothetical protein